MENKFGKFKKPKTSFKMSKIGWLWVSTLLLSLVVYFCMGGHVELLDKCCMRIIGRV